MWTVDSTTIHTDSTVFTTDGFIPATLAGAASDTTSAAGALTTAIQMAAAAADTLTAAASLTNWATVTLAAPLYTGIGGILDPSFWTSSVPGVGTVVYYDPTYITIQTNAEIVATNNNITAVVQFNDGTTWQVGLVTLTPGFVAYATDTTTASGSLSSGAVLAGAASTLVAAAGALTTQILLAAAANDSTIAAGALSTGINLQGAASTLTSAVGALSTAIQLAGAASDSVSASGGLGANFANLAGAANDVVTALGALSTQILMAGQAGDTTLASAALMTGVTFSAAASDTTSASGLLGSLQPLFGAANDLTTAAGSLLTQILLSASAVSMTSGAGNLTTAIQLSGTATDATSALGALGVLALNVRPSHLITTTFYSNQLLGTAGPLPYGEFFVRVGDVEIHAMDWAGWLSNFWGRGEIVPPGMVIRPTTPNGLSYVTTLGGQSGNSEPIWPTILGGVINDGGVIWTAQALDTTSLFATVQSATWMPPAGIVVSGTEISGQVVIAELDATAAVAGTNYTVNIPTKMSDGETKVGQIVLKVR
jgi:hypothetical protein